MTAFLFSTPTLQSMGWTLVNSLWQGLVIAFLLKLILEIIPTSRSEVRYGISVVALALMVVAMGVTFMVVETPVTSISSPGPMAAFALSYESVAPAGTSWFALVQSAINQHMDLLLLMWTTGVILFSLRLLSGLYYLHYLRSHALSVGDVWSDFMQSAAGRLKVKRPVVIRESSRVSVPMVLGHLKPVILFPVGLLTHMSTEQVESILLHELSHIRRGDYMVNLIQSFVEVLLFFNPFVWWISSQIRVERENCCDDLTVRNIEDPICYAKALAQLEEQRLTYQPLSLAATGSGNFALLKRIQRIMEKSIHQNEGKMRAWPVAALVMLGLLSASWMSINSRTGKDETIAGIEQPSASTVAWTDTTKKSKQSKETLPSPAEKEKPDAEKSASYSFKSITTYDENGEPHEEIVEDFSGDEALRSMMSFDHAFPPMWDEGHDMGLLALDGFPQDSIPGMERLDEYMKDFTTRFRSFNGNEDWNGEAMQRAMEALREQMSQADVAMNLRSFEADERIKEAMDRAREQMQGLMEQDLNFRAQEEALREMDSRLREESDKIREMEDNMRSFEQALRDELIKDGYIQKGEKVESMTWGPQGQFTINGKAIREKDQKKYEEIREKFLKSKSYKGKPE